MQKKSILVFAGSARKGSFNKKLARYACTLLAAKDIAYHYVDLADHVAPIYDGDDEADGGVPETMRTMKQLMKDHDGFLIASPEYNGFVPPLLINMFSWCSRPEEGEKNLAATSGKYVGLMATSPGPMGGIRMLPRLREALADLGAIVMPGPVAVGSSMKAFDDDGNIIDQGTAKRIGALIDNLVREAGI